MNKTTGFTLMELLITVTIIAILAAIAVPAYGRVIERSRWRTAQDVLQTIYAGEQTYATTHNDNYCDPSGTGGDPCDPVEGWRDIYMDDPNQPPGEPVAYTIVVDNTAPPTFTATATHSGETQTVDQTRAFGGDWVMP